MKHYVNSGKFNPGLTILWTILGLAAGAVISIIYTAIANWNPIIYLNFLVLLGVIFALSQTSVLIIKQTKSRNKAVNMLVTLLICFFSWYVGWAALLSYYANESFLEWFTRPVQVMDGLIFYADNIEITLNRTQISPGVLKVCYGIEFLAYLFPVFLVAQEKIYYCEFCHKFMKSSDHFFTDMESVGDHLEDIKAGNLNFIHATEKSNKISTEVPEQYKLNLHACPECGEKVFNFYHIKMKLKKGTYETGSTSDLIQNQYVVRTEQQNVTRLVI